MNHKAKTPKQNGNTTTPHKSTCVHLCAPIRSPETDKPEKQQTHNNNNNKKTTKHAKQTEKEKKEKKRQPFVANIINGSRCS
jgi:hypothetical protein